jgi:hypothetical protein
MFFLQHPGWLQGPPALLSIGYGGFFPGREADHLPPSNAEVNE